MTNANDAVIREALVEIEYWHADMLSDDHPRGSGWKRVHGNLSAALTQPVEAQWLPIDSAPLDGTRVLTRCPQNTRFTMNLGIARFELGHVPTHCPTILAPPQPENPA